MLYNDTVAKTAKAASSLGRSAYPRGCHGLPMHSRQTLLADLATLAQNTVTTALDPEHEFVVHTHPSSLQQKVVQRVFTFPF
jgi:hypothetical protein